MTVLAVLESTLPSFCLSFKNTAQRGNRDGLAVPAVSIMTTTPLELNPLFPDILTLALEYHGKIGAE